MANYVVKDVLDKLFADAAAVMDKLSASRGSFTSQQFIKHVAQKNQHDYIELLNRCLNHPDASPFNAAHQHLGHSLMYAAKRAGYGDPVDEGNTETDIFDNPTDRIVYRRQK